MFFKCTHAHHAPAARSPADEGAAGAAVSNGSKTLVVDVHCHRECQAAMEMMKAEAERVGFVPLQFGNDITRKVNAAQIEFIKPKMLSLEERIADMDRMGVDIQAVSISPYQFYYWAEPEIGRKASQMENDDLAEAVARHPDRLVGLGTVPLQNTEMAVAEMERCVDELGFRGLEINTHVGGDELSAERLAPFWARAEELGILLFMHPAGYTSPERFGDHYFLNIIGHPLESTIAISQLIFGGVIDRHPGLKICVAHGGGFLPSYAGRMDHAYHAREDVSHGLPKPPGEYLKKFYFDTMVFAPDQIEFLVEKYGADHVLLGTDYPYDMGEDDPVGLVARAGKLTDEQRTRVCGGSAAELLKLN